jgi:pSer/pThr/pTyr-binding forkhead associated (FHA) protein
MESAAKKIAELRLAGGSVQIVIAEPGEYTLGRSSRASFRIDHKTVSRRHARVLLSDDRREVFLQHDGGTNGTRLNGREIERLEPLKDGDEVQIGEVTMTASLKRI